MSMADFAAMMESGSASDKLSRKKLRPGEVVEGTVVQIGRDSVFVDVGAVAEGRIDRGELEDKQGNLQVKVGDVLKASVASVSDIHGPVLVLALGRGKQGQPDVSQLESAKENAIPVEGTVTKAVKGGLEVQVAGLRAFCPASQIDVNYVAELGAFEGQTLQFRVIEVRDGGRSVVLSRKALQESERAQNSKAVLDKITVGSEQEGTVTSVQKYGAFVDLGGGVEGLVHVSEIAHHRVEQVQDALNVGEKVVVKVLAIEPNDKSPIPKLRLSIKATTAAPASDAPEPGVVIHGTVQKLTAFGVFVETSKGTGLVPLRELGVPRGSDHRKGFPVGSEVKVVLVGRESSGKLTFSIARVAGVEEQQNYREFTEQGKVSPTSPEASSVGSFGALLRKQLNLPEPPPAAPQASATPPVQAAAPASLPEPPPAEQMTSTEAPPEPAAPASGRPSPGAFRRRYS